jgi:hypothetical protein
MSNSHGSFPSRATLKTPAINLSKTKASFYPFRNNLLMNICNQMVFNQAPVLGKWIVMYIL